MGIGGDLSGLYGLSQALFLRGLGLVYFLAYLSLYTQVRGLYCARGLAPIQEQVESLRSQWGKSFFWRAPSVFCWNASDRMQRLSLLGGIVASVALFCGWAPSLCSLYLWAIYQSFSSLGSPFLGYQWDSLLLEVGFLSIFYSLQQPPSQVWQLTLLFLLFRLMFSSGFVKWSSGCPLWRKGRAMDVHYETQPLPNMIAWGVHQQPTCLSTFSTGCVFAIELVLPFLIFTPFPGPLIAAVGFFLLQGLILITGSYAFFNLLCLLLCLPLISDRYLGVLTPWIALESQELWLGQEVLLFGIGVFLLVLNALQLARLFVRLGPAGRLLHWASNWNISNPYGLFARMTDHRDEIVIEGSLDGVQWLSYEFKWKPGDVRQHPRQVAPHQPRLDWQMWFAALGRYQDNPWYLLLLKRLLEGEVAVLALLGHNPFPKDAPKYLRSRCFSYHFSSYAHWKLTGEWWLRIPKKDYAPMVLLNEDGTLESISF